MSDGSKKRVVVSRSSYVDPKKAADAAKRLEELGSTPGTQVVQTGQTHEVHVGTQFASWTCSSCGHKNYSPQAKVMLCERCGNPKGQDEVYEEASKDAPFATKEQLDAAHISPDHDGDETCPFCGADVFHDTVKCPQCGGNIKDNIPPAAPPSTPPRSPIPLPVSNLNPRLVIGAIVAILVLCLGLTGLYFLLRPQTDQMVVQSVSWSRAIGVEEYQYLAHEGFETPGSGAENLRSEVRLTGYTDVLDHYETQKVQKSRQVIDYYETKYRTEYETVSDGYEQVCHTESVYDHTESVYDHTDTVTYSDGTTDTEDVYRDVAVYVDKPVCESVEKTHQEPVQVPYEEAVYKTEYYYVDEQVPVYRQEPIYQTYYWWNRWEWVAVAPVVASGNDNAPYWPDFQASDKRREAGRAEVLTVVFAWSNGEKAGQVFDDYHPTNIDEFAKYKPGSIWLVKHSAGGAFEVVGES